MDWIQDYQFFVFLGFVIAGFGVIAWVLMKFSWKFRLIFRNRKGGETELEQDIIARLYHVEEAVAAFKPRLESTESIGVKSIQKIGFLRFNPFQDTGGDQSFMLVLLDGKNNGILLSSLYTREGVRLYAKAIEGGKPKHPLSEEETRILKETMEKQNL